MTEKPPSQDPNPEEIEIEIQKILDELNGKYRIDQFPEELQDRIASEWYEAEEEIKAIERTPEGMRHRLKLARWLLDEISKIPKKEGK